MAPSRPRSPKAEPDSSGLPLRAQQKQFTRERLVQAAIEVMDRDGYGPATVEDIAAAAGASRATFYVHFSGKSEVVADVMERLQIEAAAIYDQLYEIEELTPEVLRAFLDDTLGYWERNRAACNVIEQAVMTDLPLSSSSSKVTGVVSDSLATHIVRWRGIDRESARVRAMMLLFQVDRACYFWIVRGLAYDRDRALDVLTENWMTTLTGPDPDSARRGVISMP
jgi:AcrR family transcriptional regulator